MRPCISMLIPIVAAALMATTTSPPSPPQNAWKRLAPGLELRMMDGGSGSRRGSRIVAVARCEPARWRLEPFAAAEQPDAHGSLDVDEWQRRTRAAIVFNAGQYYPNRVPMGLFLKDRHNLGSAQIKSW